MKTGEPALGQQQEEALTKGKVHPSRNAHQGLFKDSEGGRCDS